ncbi:hypothetical protein [Nocardioides rubriscoriae]|uniref:hypothetical protein n=1 Tax=Nocardioides rubriscoriae TaxID=642762 RepID=UPI0011E00C3C|nr:hypothetical protein [Nocardioides rubriscoriae]
MVTTRMHPVPRHGPADGARAAALVFGARGQQQWERANRQGLLAVHAFVGVFAGGLILLNGGAGVFDEAGMWMRPLTGSLALGGGALLMAGITRQRAMRLEVAGLVVLAIWDLTMTAGFVAAAAASHDVAMTWPWEMISDASSVRLYPIVLYVGLFVLMCVHLATLRQVRRVDVRGRITVARPAA